MELVTMRDAGLVVLEGDEIVCGEAPPNAAIVGDASAMSSSTAGAARGTSATTPTAAAPTVGPTYSSGNSEGKKRMDVAGGHKRGLEAVEGALGADRVTRSRSRTLGCGDEGRCEERSRVGPAGAGFGPIVRHSRGSDWAAYLIRAGQSTRLEAWRSGGNEEEDHEMVREEGEDEWGLDE